MYLISLSQQVVDNIEKFCKPSNINSFDIDKFQFIKYVPNDNKNFKYPDILAIDNKYLSNLETSFDIDKYTKLVKQNPHLQFGKTILYSEVVTSTQTILDK